MIRLFALFFTILMLNCNQLLAQSGDLLANSTEDGDFSEYSITQTGIWTNTPSTTIWPANTFWYADGATGGGGSARTCIRVHNVEPPATANYFSKYHYLNIMMDESFSTNTVYGTSILWRKLSGLTPGATYTFSFYHKLTNVLSGKSINFAITDGIETDGAYTLGTDGKANSFVKQLNGIVTFNTTESVYTQTSYTFTVPEGKTEVYAVFLRSHKTDKKLTGAMRINIDDMRLYLDQNQVIESTKSITIDKNTSVNSITLRPGGKLAINSSMTLTATNGITLESDATGTATMLNSGTFTGTVTAQQYLGTARNWYVSSPVNNATSPATNITRYYEYVEDGTNNPTGQETGSTAYWKGLVTENTMEVGKGYIAQASAGTTVSFSGTPNNGDITTTFDLTRNDAKGKGFNLVGNPYPSYIDWTDVAAANPNLDNTYYYRTKNIDNTYAFVTWNGSGNTFVNSKGGTASTTITSFIPPTQAFWVRVKSGTSTTKMYFNNAMREHRDDNGNLMKAPAQNNHSSIRLQLVNGTESDETLIYTDANAVNEYDSYDSPKMMNNSAITPDLYSKLNDESLVINGLNSISDNTELPLGFSLNAAATLKLKVTEMSNFPIGTRIFLRDKQQNSETELTPETEYSFSTTAATTNNESRFSLLFKVKNSTTETVDTERDPVSVFVNTQNEIVIIANENSNYSIYNAVGQQIATGKTNTTHETWNPKLAAGVYVVKVNNQSTRVVIK